MENSHNRNNANFGYWNSINICYCSQLWGAKLQKYSNSSQICNEGFNDFCCFCDDFTIAFAPQIASVFSSSSSSVRISGELAAFLTWIVLYYPTMAVGVASTYVFQGIGRGMTAMFQTIMRETGFTLVFALLFTFIFNWGVWGEWLGIVLGEVVSNNIT